MQSVSEQVVYAHVKLTIILQQYGLNFFVTCDRAKITHV